MLWSVSVKVGKCVVVEMGGLVELTHPKCLLNVFYYIYLIYFKLPYYNNNKTQESTDI